MIQDFIKISEKSYSHILICGDFNYPGINWEDEQCSGQEAKLFLEGIRDCYLHQHVAEPTHHRPNQQANILDLILTNEEGMVSHMVHSAPLGKSHHSVLLFTLHVYKEPAPFKSRYIFEKGDYSSMSELLRKIDWDSLLNNLNCEDAWEVMSEKIKEATDKHVPKTKPPKKRKKPIWMTQEIMTKLKEKQTAYRTYMASKTGADYCKYARLRNQTKWICRKAARDYERMIAGEAKDNPKAVFSYAKKKMKTKSGIADLIKSDNTMASSSKDKANVLNDFFSSVFTREDRSYIPDFPRASYNVPIADMSITIEDVRKKLDALNPNKATGPDEIPPRLLKELAAVLAGPIAIIMNKSIQEGNLPSIWKKANVVPIFKKGKKNMSGNYRPVSLTSVTCKILEGLVRQKLVEHLTDNNLVTDYQHGFVSGRSCSTNLLAVLDAWTETLENEGCVDTVYLDFANAFDTVPHERLLRKLSGLGVHGKILTWIRSFLSGRTQRVIVDGEESEWKDVVSGIPQGSVLGPMLFVCFVNDLPNVVTSSVLLFADDTKIFTEVPVNQQTLQQDLDKLQIWSNEWQLRFNATKCKVMHLGKQSDPASYSMTSDGKAVTLETIQMEKDLGVNVDADLVFDQHVAIQTKKANKLLGMLRRSFTSLDEESLPLLYKAIVRPHLEYCNVAWQPKWKKEREELEAIQHRATKLIPTLKDFAYPDRLKALSLPSLYYRKARGDMIECFKYISGMYKVPTNFIPLDSNSSTRGHSKKLKKLSAQKSCRAEFFTRRITNAWNSLPEGVISAPTLNTFKNRLDEAWIKYKYCTDLDWFKNPNLKRD